MVQPIRPVVSALLGKCRNLLASQPMESAFGNQFKYLELEQFRLVEAHCRKQTLLHIYGPGGQVLFRARYLPWEIILFEDHDFGWISSLFSAKNGELLRQDTARDYRFQDRAFERKHLEVVGGKR